MLRQSKRTKTLQKTLNPVWDESFTFRAYLNAKTTIKFKVKDSRLNCEQPFKGKARIDLVISSHMKPRQYWLPLEQTNSGLLHVEVSTRELTGIQRWHKALRQIILRKSSAAETRSQLGEQDSISSIEDDSTNLNKNKNPRRALLASVKSEVPLTNESARSMSHSKLTNEGEKLLRTRSASFGTRRDGNNFVEQSDSNIHDSNSVDQSLNSVSVHDTSTISVRNKAGAKKLIAKLLHQKKAVSTPLSKNYSENIRTLTEGTDSLSPDMVLSPPPKPQSHPEEMLLSPPEHCDKIVIPDGIVSLAIDFS
mmetsp:Transcript_31933/g.44532  ORF Transcript_31933/g.44532 Transcript_31933/m.44532 type:complete len:308 (-) Transcript_31933:915-1838(-)